ncbi:MAG: carbon starvation protein A [Succinivibrionaceae bacterium]|nr:carbon starvation protein A [Succinivibrionaceae bacterium]
MTASLIFCICLAYFVAAYFLYGGYLRKVFAIDPKRPTPAHSLYDGIDYVPTPRVVIFGHHFASIAGPGPIVGPIMAAYFGWLPALIWILVGCVFVGAFHDFAALVISARNKGRSISFVMERLMGYSGRQMFLLFCLCCLVLVVAIFTLMIAGLFVSMPEVATASLLFILMAPIFAKITMSGVSLRKASVVFVPLVFLTVLIGNAFPLNVMELLGLERGGATTLWLLVLAVYIFFASVVPVQWLLQPRDYLNSWLLYAMLLLGFVSILAYNPEIKMDSFHGWSAITANGKMTAMIPALFIFIACGACSGFHALVASGTTSKQVDNERDMLPIGYGAMLLEGVLGVMALVAVMAMDPAVFMETGRNQPLAFATGIASFSGAIGIDAAYAKIFISLAISAFMMTSLDTATRLGRFICQEMFMPRSVDDESVSGYAAREPAKGALARLFTNKYLASLTIIAMAMGMAISGEAASIWPIFGASNQLMSALTLLVVTLWLLARGSKWQLALVPMIFMMVMSLWGVIDVVRQQWGENLVLVCAGVFLVVMAVLMILMGLSIINKRLFGQRQQKSLA